MATQTQHFSLTKPDWEDRASISVLNANTDIIDAQMYDNEQSAANAIGNMAAEYDDTATYEVGDFCIYSEVLYKCVTAVTVAEAFDSTKWTQTTAAENFGSGGGGGSSTLAGLTDVNLTSPTDGQALVYDATNQEWVNGAGGGTGGHVIINENGASMTARAGLQFVGGANVSDDNVNNRTVVDIASAGGIDGVFIDTGNVIKAQTTITANVEVSYTATEDCCIVYLLYGANDSAGVLWVDNTIISAFNITLRDCIFIKKGQIVKFRSMTQDGSYTVYGIQIGTTHSKFQPIIYSTEEKEIGVWIDGKPLYRKSFPFNFTQTVSSWSFFDNSVSYETLVYTEFSEDIGSGIQISGNPNSSSTPRFCIQSNELKYFTSVANISGIVTFFYTKTTDTAGSGVWTTSGVPAVHYSTEEQVVGTWIDGKPIYEKTIEFATAIQTSAAGSWTNTRITLASLSIDKLISGNSIDTTGQAYPLNLGKMSNDTYIGIAVGIVDRNISVITIRYTKTTD